ncbi:MAG: bifunctional adenosylcobinamide kinase/adenosylcobinamide-phosphate guanylyltransferase [Cyanobacteria bacterium SID2]|nr:bifunctional adenosylcobinamide kinase/adenosylcobinamide-phosphate guanylyltransferase [Cyanobacteria bacterium SID2]MBP0003554.1 bifunctional adenosylcobinamide kinase/adenosylcobinamide-phosphate guanylyltransferase [Cyanobacteria bacterium SBC]
MIYFITGGQRSGKSKFAQQLAKRLSDTPIYLATSRVWDDNHLARIRRHQIDRDASWRTVEEEKYISKHQFTREVVVLDCITLWLTNFFADTEFNLDETLELAKGELLEFLEQDFTLIAISNEIGMGLHGEHESGRKFVDLQGWINQFLAERADEVFFMVSGLPLKVK